MDLNNVSEDTEIYVENEDFIILNNSDMIPIIIWKDKDVVRDLIISRTMKKAIQKVGEEKYGRGNFFIDRLQSGKEKYLSGSLITPAREEIRKYSRILSII